ncbi:MAG: OmpH family outer membrane protein [Gemmatimonadota bacterium]
MRTRLVLLAALVGAGLAAAPAAGQGTATKIGYVNSDAVLAQAPGADVVRAQIQQLQQGFAGRVQPLEDSLQTMLTTFQQQQAMLSPEARQQREREITAKQQEFQQRVAQMEQEAEQQQRQLMAPLMERINVVIQTYRQEHGYGLILDSSTGILVAADEALDLTEAIVALLQPAGGATPPPQD